MSNWIDQAPRHTEQLLHVMIGDARGAEIEEVLDTQTGDPIMYRLTVGNLFGSASALFRTLPLTIKALHYVSNTRAPWDLTRMRGFIEYEKREGRS